MKPLKGTERFYRAARARLNAISGGGGMRTVTIVAPSEVEVRASGGSPTGDVGTIEFNITKTAGGFTVAIAQGLAVIGLQAIHLLLDGTRAMQGNLNMASYAIQYLWNLAFNGTVGSARITGVRRITATGDDADSEGLIDGLERVQFNEDPTTAVVDRCGHIEFQVAVNPDSHYTPNNGTASWSSLERIFIVNVTSGSALMAGFIASGVALYEPDINGITTAFLDSSVVIYAPAVALDINPGQDVTAGYVFPSVLFYGVRVDLNVDGWTIGSTATTSPPEMSYAVDASSIGSTATLYQAGPVEYVVEAALFAAIQPDPFDLYEDWSEYRNYGSSPEPSHIGQTFPGNGLPLARVEFYVNRGGGASPCYAELYETTGTLGVDAKPTGSPIATSENNPPGNWPYAAHWEAFDFPTRPVVEDGTAYAVALYYYPNGVDGSWIYIYRDYTAASHQGNQIVFYPQVGTWGAGSTSDVCFRVYSGGATLFPPTVSQP